MMHGAIIDVPRVQPSLEGGGAHRAKVAARRLHAWQRLPLCARARRRRDVEGVQARRARPAKEACLGAAGARHPRRIVQRARAVVGGAAARHGPWQRGARRESVSERVVNERGGGHLVAVRGVAGVAAYVVHEVAHRHGGAVARAGVRGRRELRALRPRAGAGAQRALRLKALRSHVARGDEGAGGLAGGGGGARGIAVLAGAHAEDYRAR